MNISEYLCSLPDAELIKQFDEFSSEDEARMGLMVAHHYPVPIADENFDRPRNQPPRGSCDLTSHFIE
jgi:hypothetical protein